MRHAFALVLLLAFVPPAFAETLVFEGFHLGMSKADATKLRPQSAWRPASEATATGAERKEFTAEYLGREAEVSIGLDPDGKFIRLIAFAFRPESGSQCILDAVGARLQLERRHGKPLEAVSESFGRSARWLDGEGVSIRWMEACAVGAGGYFVTYAKPAD